MEECMGRARRSVREGTPKKTTARETAPQRLRTVLICLILAAAVACAFWQVGRCDFTNLDDDTYVTENSHVSSGLTWDNLGWAFTSGYASNWHPLTWMSHMLDVQLFGLNPAWHHVINLLFHIANTVLLFLVLFRMTKGLWQSAFVAALFGLHPLHVESVAWIAERKDVLSTFFWFLTMGAYIRYIEKKGLGRYLALLVCFALGLMSKPMLVTLPFVLLLLDYWPLHRFREEGPASKAARRTEGGERSGKSPGQGAVPIDQSGEGPGNYTFNLKSLVSLAREKTPLFAMALLSSAITIAAQQKGGAVQSLEVLPLGVRIANAFVSYWAYLGSALLPDNLGVFYPHPGSLPLWQTLPAVLFLAVATAAVIRLGRKWPCLPVGWLWYIGTLVPVIGVMQVGTQARADRYTYIPLVGLFIMAAWAIPQLPKGWRYGKQALAASSAAVLLSFFVATWVQVGYWKNSLTLYDHTLAVAAPSGLVLNNLGKVYQKSGDYVRAVREYDSAIRTSPQLVDAYNGRGIVYNALADYPRAIKDFDKAVELNPAYADAYNNRGTSYTALHDWDRAIADFDHAIAINPQHAKALWNRAIAYGMGLGDFTKAIADCDRALSLNPPEAAGIYRSRGAARGATGDFARAIADFDRAIEIDPQYAQAYYDRGMTYNRIGNRSRAIDDLTEATRLGSGPARKLLSGQGRGG
jgi:tetratricopeptide (TPR) repeat protein